LINYSQITNVIAKTYDVNYNEMWLFSDEIHKLLGNRPKDVPWAYWWALCNTKS